MREPTMEVISTSTRASVSISNAGPSDPGEATRSPIMISSPTENSATRTLRVLQPKYRNVTVRTMPNASTTVLNSSGGEMDNAVNPRPAMSSNRTTDAMMSTAAVPPTIYLWSLLGPASKLAAAPARGTRTSSAVATSPVAMCNDGMVRWLVLPCPSPWPSGRQALRISINPTHR